MMSNPSIYIVTKRMFPAFVKLYRYANRSSNSIDEWELLHNMIIRAAKTNSCLTYDEKERTAINHIRKLYLVDETPLYASDGGLSYLDYYKDIKLEELLIFPR